MSQIPGYKTRQRTAFTSGLTIGKYMLLDKGGPIVNILNYFFYYLVNSCDLNMLVTG